MVIDEVTSNGECTDRALEVKCVKSVASNNVTGVGLRNVTQGFPAASIGFRTYKRRKRTKSTFGNEGTGDGKTHVEAGAACQLADQTVGGPLHMLRESNSCDYTHRPIINIDQYECPEVLRRSVFLQHICQSSSEGSIPMSVQNAIAFHSGISCPSRIFDAQDGHRNNFLSLTGLMSSTVQTTAHRGATVVSNESLEKSNQCSINDKCRQTFCKIIDSQKFISLCKLLSENFRGIKADNVFDFSIVNSRMKEGAYENSPTLFLSDIQQVWGKFQAIGTELVSLATSLLDFSKNVYHEQVGVSGCNAIVDGNHELSILESASHAKAEHTDGYGACKVCTCRSCGEKADGIDCLVCDSCEEVYHVSCINPPVKEIPIKSWYCASCTASGFGLHHDNCVVCERLNTPKTITTGVAEILLTNGHNHYPADENPKCCTDDGLQHLDIKNLGPCKICGNEVEGGDKFRICSHPFCSQKGFHARCLTKKQLRSYGTRWYCPSCLCRVCLIDRDDDKIVLCDGCDHGYHIYCLGPPLSAIPKGQWFCSKCEAGIQAIHMAKRAYENSENGRNTRGKDALRCYDNLSKRRNNGGEEEFDKGSGGMDMLLTAAKTLNYEEGLAAFGN